jgi:hypothetical protein
MKNKIDYAEIGIGDAEGRCRWCGAKMELLTHTKTEITWKHPEPIEDNRCDEYQIKK